VWLGKHWAVCPSKVTLRLGSGMQTSPKVKSTQPGWEWELAEEQGEEKEVLSDNLIRRDRKPS